MFIETFVKRPILSSVCSIIILLAGLICIAVLPVEYYPQLAPTQITVSANYVGADATTVESTVTTPLEQAINGARAMKYMTSSSGNDGTSTINVVFDNSRDQDDALLDVETRVKQIEPTLPAEVKATGVSIYKNSTAMVLMYTIRSKNNEYDTKFLSNYADRYIKDYVQRVDGVANVIIYGEQKYAMRIWLDPYKLANRNLTPNDVVNALMEQNVQVAAGKIGGTPSNKDQKIAMNIQVPGRLVNTSEFEEIVIKSENGSIVRLKDVARAELGAESYDAITSYNGGNTVALAIMQLPDANAMEVAKGVKTQMAELEKKFPPGMEALLSIDSTNLVKESIKEVLLTLIGSVLLVVLVIYIFLQRFKTTLIPAVAIPVSLVGSFIFMKLLSFSINTLTLFGIVLAIGLVVDDAIIVVENIERFIKEKNMPPKDAAIEGLKEIFGAVIASSLVLITVFVPIAFFPGITGKLYKQFALTIAFSIFFSAFVSITLTPAMSALLLSKKEEKSFKFFEKFNSWLEKVIAKYKIILEKIILKRKQVFTIFLGLLAATVLLFQVVPQSFVPTEDQSYFTVMLQAPEGYSLENTRKINDKIIKALQTEKDEIIGVFDFTGYSFTGVSPNKGIMFVILKPTEERKGKYHSSEEIVKRINVEFSKIPDAIINAFGPPAIDGIGTVGGFQFEIKDDASHTLEELSTTTQNVISEGYQSLKLSNLYTTFTANNPQIDVQVDKLKAKQMNLSLKDIYDTLQISMGSYYVNDFTYLNKSYRVYVQADNAFRRNFEDIGQLYVRNNEGQMIPVSNLITYKMNYNPDTINHYNLRRSTEISGEAASGASLGDAAKEMEKIAKKILPQNFSYEWSGVVLESQSAGASSSLIFVLSLVFVFLILAAQYENLFSPAIILMAVPLAIFGAMSFQFLRGLENDVFCQIGLVMLIGLASKNAILIVEFANQLTEQGKSLKDAALEACLIRFRPIMMTSLTCILGILPLVLAHGVGAKSRISMGTAVFGGMLVSTFLNLFVTPILYIIVMTIQKRLKMAKNPEIKKRFINYLSNLKNKGGKND